jgi:hypothetical protein
MGYDNLTFSFILPKESLWQTFQTQLSRHSWYGLLFVTSAILTLIGSLFGIIKLLFFRGQNPISAIITVYATDIKALKNKKFVKKAKTNERK